MQVLTLYTTEHCHLCEAAMELLLSLPELPSLELRVVDIVSDDRLFERYAQCIPVLVAGGEELTSPITATTLRTWLNQRVLPQG
jgi:hypothetical protein